MNGYEVSKCRPVLHVRVTPHDAGSDIRMHLRPSLVPVIFPRAISLGLLDLAIGKDADHRKWESVFRSLEQSVSPALR